MNCPVCNKELVQQNFGINVDVCANGCNGMFFEIDELRMLDETNEGLGEALEAALRNPRDNQGQRGQIQCPKCDIPMQTHKYRRAKEVNVDECYKCGGFFLDSGELTEARDNAMTDEEIQTYADEILDNVPGYSAAVADQDARAKRIEAIHKYTKYLTYSYWRKQFQDKGG